MTLRLSPADVATLEGLVELDKPIPIYTDLIFQMETHLIIEDGLN